MPAHRTFIRKPRQPNISKFSAFEDAKITLGALTIITGPQASGKSLVCKLIYFFQETFSEISSAVQEGQSYSQFVKGQAVRFSEWFPPSAWGSSRFNISYSTDQLVINVIRVTGRGGLRTPSRLSMETILDLYMNNLLKYLKALRVPASAEIIRYLDSPSKSIDLKPHTIK